MTSIVKKYLSALVSLLITLGGALVIIPSGHLDWQAGVQLGILGVTTLTTLWLKLLPVKWQSVLKTGSAIVLAILGGLTPLILGGVYDHTTIGIIVLSVLQVIAPELGTLVRTDDEVGAPPAVTVVNASK
jgi:hypothetical protein